MIPLKYKDVEYEFDMLLFENGPKILIDVDKNTLMYWNGSKPEEGYDEFLLITTEDENMLRGFLTDTVEIEELTKNGEVETIGWKYNDVLIELDFGFSIPTS